MEIPSTLSAQPILKQVARLKEFAPIWEQLTSDTHILDTVQHCHIEFVEDSQSCNETCVRIQRSYHEEEQIINKEIIKLCGKGVIEEANHFTGEFISPIFTRKKKRWNLSSNDEKYTISSQAGQAH